MYLFISITPDCSSTVLAVDGDGGGDEAGPVDIYITFGTGMMADFIIYLSLNVTIPTTMEQPQKSGIEIC